MALSRMKLLVLVTAAAINYQRVCKPIVWAQTYSLTERVTLSLPTCSLPNKGFYDTQMCFEGAPQR